ncbi:MAG: glycosyltransferase family 4 protein [Planctomycetota bacterium]
MTTKIDARVVFLTHYIPLYQVQVLRAIADQVREFQVLVSTPIEPNRDFNVDWEGLDVTVQKTVTLRRRWRHRGDGQVRFDDPLFVHIPVDTRSQLRSRKPDVVMSLELGARSLGAVRYCQSSSAKSVLCTYMSEHTETHRGRLRNYLRKYLVKRANAITFNGPSCRSYLQSMGAEDRQLYRLAYAADDRTAIHQELNRDDASTRSTLLYVGQLSDRKGVLPMLRQLSAYCQKRPEQKIQLQIVGEGPLKDSVAAFDSPGNLTIKMYGSLSPAELSAKRTLCGASIAPTLADEWLLVANESLHAGLPIIGSRYAQAVTTLIRDGENGWVYDPANDSSIESVLDQYFTVNSAEMVQMWRRCQKSIEHCTPQWAAAGAIKAVSDLVARDTHR